MPVRCYCTKCHGAIVDPRTRSNHERATLKNYTVSQQNIRRPDLAYTDTTRAGSSTTDPLPPRNTAGPHDFINDRPSRSNAPIDLDHSALSGIHLADITPDENRLSFDFEPEQPQFNQIVNHINIAEEDQEFPCQESYDDDDQDDFADEDVQPMDQDPGHGDGIFDTPAPLPSAPTEDDPDPFLVDRQSTSSSANVLHIPDHLLIIYAMVSWLHLQFNLPRIACNAVLTILAYFVTFLKPQLSPPFISLQSITRTLALDPSIDLLPVCPKCREVFPPVASEYVRDMCTSCNKHLFLSDRTKRGNLRGMKTPVIKYPYLSLTQQLISVLKIPGMEASLDNWRTKERAEGVYTDIFDGDMCRRHLKAPDGSLFFSNLTHESNGPNGELRIGVNLGVDWFSHIRSNIAPSHSSCPTSFSICNLPPEYRYRTSNLMCTSILPGPKEQNPNEIQRFLRPIISDLLRLWKDGIRVPTESRPDGRLVRVILVAVVCDKPAAHKIGGFASHSHTHFCTLCWISLHDNGKATAFQNEAFRRRTNHEHRRLGEMYRQLSTPTAQKNFVKEHATRYSQLSRLPYFDLVEQVVIDPMHNLFLGLVKTHFYGIWVQRKILRPNHELVAFHSILADFTIPTSCGKLPTDIGVPSGGSLTADQWLLLATVYGPVAVPQLWTSSLRMYGGSESSTRRIAYIAEIEAEKDRKARRKAENKKALADAKSQGKEAVAAVKARIAQECAAEEEAKKVERTRITEERQAEKARIAKESKGKQAEKKAAKRKATSQTIEGLPEREQPGPPLPSGSRVVENHDLDGPSANDDRFSLHSDDPRNFLKLCSAIRILIRRRLTDSNIEQADRLLREYCTELITLYGSGVIKPNHHYASHISEFVRNFGPLHDFWTYLYERLNKVLKSFNTNNHGQGALETTFFTEFHRTCYTSRLIYTLLCYPQHSLPRDVAEVMLKATNDERGTVAGLATLSQALEEEHEDGCVSYGLSPRRHMENMSTDTYRVLAQTIRERFPSTPVHCRSDRPTVSHSLPLERTATFFEYVVIDGKRYHASRTVGANKSSFAHVLITAASLVNAYGEVLEIFQVNQHLQQNNRPPWFVRMRWFKPWSGEREEIWDEFQSVNVRLWELGEYLGPEAGLPALIDPAWIKGQLALTTVSIGHNRAKLWATVDLAK